MKIRITAEDVAKYVESASGKPNNGFYEEMMLAHRHNGFLQGMVASMLDPKTGAWHRKHYREQIRKAMGEK